MAEYNLHHLIQECVDEHAGMKSTSRGHTNGARLDIYMNSWFALNTWIESQLCKRKGAEVPLLGKFTWDFKKASDDEELQCRPLFLLSDNFAKVHHIRRQRIHKFPLVAPSENINYSKLAIKYSKILTKDMVSAGVRDIIKKIGDFVDRVAEFRIDFTFGTLKSKEREIKFEFNYGRIQQILPEKSDGLYVPDDVSLKAYSISTHPFEPQTHNVLPESTDPATSARSNYSSRYDSTLPLMNKTLGKTSITPRFTMSSNREQISLVPLLQLTVNEKINSVNKEIIREENAQTIELDTKTTAKDHFQLSMSPRMQELFLSLNAMSTACVNKNEIRSKRVEKVQHQAYLKCVEELETLAQTSEFLNNYNNGTEEDLLHENLIKKQAAKTNADNLKYVLDNQKAEEQNRRDKEKETMRSMVAAFFLKDDSTINPPGSIDGRSKVKVKEDLKKQLIRQIKMNADRNGKDKFEKILEESEYLDHLAMELDLENMSERASHLEKQKSLLESWERDGHIRNLKKLQEKGVAPVYEYIQRNLPDALNSTRAVSTSVGFDSRKK